MSPAQQTQELDPFEAASRPALAKGMLLSGSFLPSEGGSSLTRAPHLHRDFTSVSVRFLKFSRLHKMPQADDEASRSGCAIRFHLGEYVHTDILAYSGNAQATEGKALPRGVAEQQFIGWDTYRFTNQKGRLQFGRYRIRPSGPNSEFNMAPACGKSSNFPFGQIRRQVAMGPVKLQVLVQLASAGDILEDAAIRWPEERPLVDFGCIYLTGTRSHGAGGQRQIVFDSIPRVDGIETANGGLEAL